VTYKKAFSIENPKVEEKNRS